MKKYNFQKGRRGEDIAGEFLQKKGYKILEKNFHTRYGEIDIICTKSNKLVFVEVKLKVGEEFGTPEEMISKGKIFQITRTAQSFLQKNPKIQSQFPSYQIDAVAIVMDENKEVNRITHYENIGADF